MSKDNNSKKKEEIYVDESTFKPLKRTYDLYTSNEFEVKKIKRPEIDYDDVDSGLRVKGPQKKKQTLAPKKLLKNLSPKRRKQFKNIIDSITDEQVQQWKNLTKKEEEDLLGIETSAQMDGLSKEEKAMFMNTLKELELSEEEEKITTSAIISWLDNMDLGDYV